MIRYGLALMLAVALVTAGCGGDDDDGGGGEPLTEQQFITQADQICVDGDKEINQAAREVFQQGDQPSEDEQIAFIEDTFVPETQAQADAIRELTPPEGDEDEVNAMLDALDQGIDEIESDPEAAFTSNENPLAEASQLASDYGLQACGQG